MKLKPINYQTSGGGNEVITFSADLSYSDKGYLIYPPLLPSRAADRDGSRRTRTDEKLPTSHDLQYHLVQKQTSSIYNSKYNPEKKKEDHRGLVPREFTETPKRNALKCGCVQNMDFKLTSICILL